MRAAIVLQAQIQMLFFSESESKAQQGLVVHCLSGHLLACPHYHVTGHIGEADCTTRNTDVIWDHQCLSFWADAPPQAPKT